MKIVIGLVTLALASAALAQCPRSGQDSVAIVRCRYIEETLPTDANGRGQLQQRTEFLMRSLRPDGTWPDVDYVSPLRSEWPASQHLIRVLSMAKSAYLVRSAGHSDPALEASVLSALRYWLKKDPTNPNWWWNEIGTQQLLGEIGLLMRPILTNDDTARMLPILKRSNWSTWTGANLVWGVTNQIMRGVLYDDEPAVAQGYARLYEEIQQVPAVLPNGKPGEGIQADDSFHQHGAQFYSGGYGLDYTNYAARYITYSWGTPLQIPAEKMQTFANFVLDGQQWMVRGEVFDYAAAGREITRKDEAAVQHDWTHGPIAGYDAAYTLANVMTHLAEQSVPRQGEFRAFADRLNGQAGAMPLTGNRMFWDSDYMSHRRAGYSTSVKMFSTRIQNSEITNSEGRWSTHLSDGMNLLYRTGDEYRGIFAGWDWALVPGTTAAHAYRPDGAPDTGERSIIDGRGKSDFVGGVSDGTYGVATMNLERGTLSARKSWFFFDSLYVALGTGISSEKESAPFFATDINQTLLHGAVITNLSSKALESGSHTYKRGVLQYVHHDGTGYVLGDGLKVVLSNALQSGRWSNFGTGPDETVEVPVFNLWIDHGPKPRNATYQYTVMPGATVEQTEEESTHPSVLVLSNTDDLQAVFVPRLKLLSIVVRKQGALDTPLGRISVSEPSAVMIKEDVSGYEITAANPANQPLSFRVTIGVHEAKIELPGGSEAGSSVSVHLPR
ncbi:polysaccharide lyase family 8 super-sandwich domain-containing protein [Granulicella mallensis]|uniref:Chondroitin AC lyase n=1 Tax=Granulicella mallensis TaxID=940614 RepID=A0A7W7ZUG2_9BACT|nr:polysaccharide lyase family 8 super-sandwich domain-containing protein [Granulicella mallensis]MBB5066321.1 chondroitin AC lyase [Granulicella mallensis]